MASVKAGVDSLASHLDSDETVPAQVPFSFENDGPCASFLIGSTKIGIKRSSVANGLGMNLSWNHVFSGTSDRMY